LDVEDPFPDWRGIDFYRDMQAHGDSFT